MSDMMVHVTVASMYEFEGWKFEYYRTKPLSPWPLKKDLEPRARAGNKFYDMLGRFLELSVEDQETFRI